MIRGLIALFVWAWISLLISLLFTESEDGLSLGLAATIFFAPIVLVAVA
ncbi:hypothetical protein [Phyllobacterium sp. SB3]